MGEITDDGAGFDPAVSKPGHFGIAGMREHAMQAGGSLTIESAPGFGTQVKFHLPLPRSVASALADVSSPAISKSDAMHGAGGHVDD